MIAAFLASRFGQYLLIGAAIAAAIGFIALVIFQKGEAAAAAAATAAALERTAAAARARANVKPNDQASMDRDEFNRDVKR